MKPGPAQPHFLPMCKMGHAAPPAQPSLLFSAASFSAPQPLLLLQDGNFPAGRLRTARREGARTNASSRTHGSHTRTYKAGTGSSAGPDRAPLTRTARGEAPLRPRGRSLRPAGRCPGAGCRARPSAARAAQQRPPPAAPLLPAAEALRTGARRWLGGAAALIAPGRGKAWRSPTAGGGRKRRGRAGAEPHRCPHRTAPSSPPVALRPLAAPVQPGR